MLGFDALGTLALGQAANQGASTIVLVANAGAYTITGNALVFRGALALAAGAYVVTGTAAGGASSLLAAAGAYALAGGAAALPATLSAAAGGYALAGQPAAIRGVLVAFGGAYVVAPSAAPLRPSLAAQGGAWPHWLRHAGAGGDAGRRRRLCADSGRGHAGALRRRLRPGLWRHRPLPRGAGAAAPAR